MPTQDRKNNVDQYDQSNVNSNEGSFEITQRSSGLDGLQRTSGFDSLQRSSGIDVSNKRGSIEIVNTLQSVPILDRSDFGHSAKYVSKFGSIESAENAKVLENNGTISTGTMLDIVNNNSISLSSRTFVQKSISWMHYALVTDGYESLDDAKVGIGNNISITMAANVLDAIGVDNSKFLNIPIIIPVTIQGDEGIGDAQRFTRIIGPFVLPVYDHESAGTHYNADGVSAGVNSVMSALDTIVGYKSPIWHLELDIGNECINILTFNMEYNESLYDEVRVNIHYRTSMSYDHHYYDITFTNGGDTHTNNIVDIGRCRYLEITTFYVKDAVVTNGYVKLAGQFDSESFQYENHDWGYFLDFGHHPSSFGTRGITSLGIDISPAGTNPVGVKMTVKAECNFGGGASENLETYSSSELLIADPLQQDNTYYFSQGSTECNVVNTDMCFRDYTNVSIKEYGTGSNISIATKLISQATHEHESDGSYNAILIGNLSGDSGTSFSMCVPVEHIVSINTIRSTVYFDICIASTVLYSYLCVRDRSTDRVRYCNIIGNGNTTSLFRVNKSNIIDKINVITEDERTLGFYVKYSDNTECYFSYQSMLDNDSGKLFNKDTSFINNSWCTGYLLSSFSDCIKLSHPIVSNNNGVSKQFSIVSANADVAFPSNDMCVIKCLSGEPQVFTVNDSLNDSIGVITDGSKLALSVIKMFYPFNTPSVMYSINTGIDSDQTSPRGIISSISGIGRNITNSLHSKCIVTSIPLDVDTGAYTLLPTLLSQTTNIDNDNITKPLPFNGVLGKTPVVVGSNIYEQSRYKLIRKNSNAILPESGDITIYGGLAIVVNNSTTTMYAQSELGFQYLTSIPDAIVSNIVNVSGNLIFVGHKAIYSYANGVINKLVSIASESAQIRSINGSDFTVLSINDSDVQCEASNGICEAADGIMNAFLFGISTYQIEQDLSLSEVSLTDGTLDNYFLLKTNNVVNEEVLLFNEYYNVKQLSKTNHTDLIKLTTRDISFEGNGSYGFMCEYLMIKAFTVYDDSLQLPTGDQNYIDVKLHTSNTTTSIYRVYVQDLGNTVAQRLFIPIGATLTECKFSLTMYPTIRLVSASLLGKYTTEFE